MRNSACLLTLERANDAKVVSLPLRDGSHGVDGPGALDSLKVDERVPVKIASAVRREDG